MELVVDLFQRTVRWLMLYSMTDPWSRLTADQRRDRRANWPRWRQLVRPAGAVVFWISVIWSVTGNQHTTPRTVTIRIIIAVALAPFIIIGVRDWVRDGRAIRAARAPKASTAAEMFGRRDGGASAAYTIRADPNGVDAERVGEAIGAREDDMSLERREFVAWAVCAALVAIAITCIARSSDPLASGLALTSLLVATLLVQYIRRCHGRR